MNYQLANKKKSRPMGPYVERKRFSTVFWENFVITIVIDAMDPCFAK